MRRRFILLMFVMSVPLCALMAIRPRTIEVHDTIYVPQIIYVHDTIVVCPDMEEMMFDFDAQGLSDAEKDSLLAAISKEIEYYNDEELDRYRGTASSDYTDEAVEEFRDVLYTMKEYEVAGWVRSLQLRAIELPDALKDEVFLIVGERRK